MLEVNFSAHGPVDRRYRIHATDDCFRCICLCGWYEVDLIQEDDIGGCNLPARHNEIASASGL